MLKQEYSVKNLSKVIRHKHIVSWDMWNNNSEKARVLKDFADKINESDKLTGKIIVQSFNGKNTYRPELVEDFLKLKLTNYFIKRIYKISQADRRMIIRQIKTILADGSPYGLLKLDISNFYESIDFRKMIDRLKEDMYLCNKGIKILESLADKMGSLPPQHSADGLPRGIDISATLSELFMADLDSEIKKIDGIFFYARYVDDIIVIYNANKKSIENECNTIISSHGLAINCNKKKAICFDEHYGIKHDFDFLGYNFKITSRRKEKQVEVNVAKSKINKQKIRIAHAFVAYSKDRDLPLLKRRLRFLSGVVHLQSDNRGVLSAGNAFNYSELTNEASLKELDKYVYRILRGKRTRVGLLLESTIPENTIRELLNISFRVGYRDRLAMNYSRLQAKKIKKAWIAS